MSPVPTFSSFAVAGGAGGIGVFITTALLEQGASVVVLSSTTKPVPDGATLRVVDYSNKAALTEALRGIDVVVSALSGPVLGSQTLIADAAKEAGVQHFVPSEYGMRTIDLPSDSLMGTKVAIHKHLESIGLPYTLYFIGFFSDFIFIPLCGWDVPNRKITIVGDGNTPASYATRADIGHFVAYTLTHLAKERLHNAALRIEAEKLTPNEIVKIFEDVYGGKFEVVYRDAAEAERAVKEKGKAAFVDFLLLAAHQGYLDVLTNDNALVPNWKPTSVKDALQKYFA